eukprot:5700620-Alexandrium_andersonii.AAC.1
MPFRLPRCRGSRIVELAQRPLPAHRSVCRSAAARQTVVADRGSSRQVVVGMPDSATADQHRK